MQLDTIIRFISDVFVNPISIEELPELYKYQKVKNIKMLLDFNIPWMTFGARNYLNQCIKKDMYDDFLQEGRICEKFH